MKNGWHVYGLIDPRFPEVIQYIGISREPEKRLNGHCAPFSGTAKMAAWIAELRGLGISPSLVILHDRLNETRARAKERQEVVTRQPRLNTRLNGQPQPQPNSVLSKVYQQPADPPQEQPQGDPFTYPRPSWYVA